MISIIGGILMIAGTYRLVFDPGPVRARQNWEWAIDIALLVIGGVVLLVNHLLAIHRIKHGISSDQVEDETF